MCFCVKVDKGACVKVGGLGVCVRYIVCMEDAAVSVGHQLLGGPTESSTDRQVIVPLAHVHWWSSAESHPSVGRHSSSHTPVPPSRPARTGPVET